LALRSSDQRDQSRRQAQRLMREAEHVRARLTEQQRLHQERLETLRRQLDALREEQRCGPVRPSGQKKPPVRPPRPKGPSNRKKPAELPGGLSDACRGSDDPLCGILDQRREGPGRGPRNDP
jgi:hypothetical protein